MTERELTRLMRQWRSGRATKSLGQALMDGYVVVFAVAMCAIMVGNLVWQSQAAIARCHSGSCLLARTMVPWIVLTVSVTAALGVASLIGPIAASAAEGLWLLSAPIDRAKLLGRRLYFIVIGSAAVAALVGGLAALLSGTAPVPSLAWAAATGFLSGGVVAVAAAIQGGRRQWLRAGMWVAQSCVVALAGLLVAARAGWVEMRCDPQLGERLALAVAAVGIACMLVAVVVARGRINRIRRDRLTAGGTLLQSLSGAMFAMDVGLLRDIVVARRAAERGSVTPRRGGPRGVAQLIWREWRLTLRNWPRLLVLGLSLIVLYAVIALGLTVIAPLVGGLALMGALIGLCQGLRIMTRTPGLARMIPLSQPQLRMVMLVIPALAALAWAVGCFWAFAGLIAPTGMGLGQAAALSATTAVAGLLGAARWTLSQPINWSAPMLATPGGAMPTGMTMNLVRGFDFVVLITMWVAFGLSPVISLIVAALCAASVVGWFDVQRLRAAEERQKRLAAEAKKTTQRTKRSHRKS